MSQLDVVGKSIPQIAAREKACGHTKFVTDLTLPRMLHGRVLRSPYPHAKIHSIDTSRAEALPGVKAVVTYADTPKIKFGPRTEDWTIFAGDKARFHGDEVAAVAAVDLDTAEEALELIHVTYEELAHVTSPLAAMEPGAPLVHAESPGNIGAEFKIEAGNVDKALDDSFLVYEDQFYTNQVYQAYMEPMAVLADVDLSGRLTLRTGTQIPNMLRMTYAKALGMSPDKIRIIVPEYGGAFGGKMENNIHLVAAILAQKAGRPVKMVNTRHEDFLSGNPRVPMHFDIKLGATREGILTAKDVRVVGAAGARIVYSQVIVSTACYRVDSLYRFKNVRAQGLTVYTNTVPTACYRGFGNSQSTFVLESAMDELADRLKIDPVELRMKNGIGSNETSVHGWKIGSSGLRECITKASEAANWHQKKEKKKPFKGIGLACCNHVSGNRPFAREFDGGSGIVRIGKDGRVTVYHGESDMGQGQNTAFAQIVAERLGVPMEMVNVAPVDTDISPFGLGSFASRGTLMGGNGVLAAAKDAYDQMAAVAAKALEVDIDTLQCRKGLFSCESAGDKTISFQEVASLATIQHHGAPIVGTGFYVPPTQLPDPVTKKGNISPAYPFGCQIAEVEVDPDTGQVSVTNMVAAHDVGRAINPMATEGQIEGGIAQGLGWTLMENMAYEKGKMLNADFVDYIVPSCFDIPDIKSILVEPVEPNGPYGAKGIGEPALNPTMAAITNAIFNAVGVRIRELPVDPQKLLAEMKKKAIPESKK
jgi:CO/xanthine dehydrogenase Mo-binding subunit